MRRTGASSGIDWIGTNALLRNVSGNTSTNISPVTASGERTSIPTHVPTQIIAEEKASSRTIAASTWLALECVRQPTNSRVPVRTTIDSAMPASSAR